METRRGTDTLLRTKARAAAKTQPQTPAPQALPGANRDLLDMVLRSLDDDKAEDVVVIDLADKSSIADFMVIATGRSSRQVITMAEHLAEAMKARGAHLPSVEGQQRGDWVLVDGGDVIVHLFRAEIRAFYNLEKMWGAQLDEPPAKLQGTPAPALLA